MGELLRLYVDESGDHHFYDYSKPEHNTPSERYLALLGVAIRKGVREKGHVYLEELKRDILDSDPDNPIVLHRKEIIHKQGPFKILQDPKKEKEFNDALLEFLRKLEFFLFLVVIDKKHHTETYKKSAFPVYPFALTAMLERYCGFLNYFNHKGDVWAEARGKKEDRSLENAYSYIYEKGTYYHESPFFQRALTSKNIKIKSKKANITGLQIADVLAHPCKMNFLHELDRTPDPPSGFAKDLCACVRGKYNMQIWKQKVRGYGKVFIG